MPDEENATKGEQTPQEYFYQCQDCGEFFTSDHKIEYIFLCPPCLNAEAGGF